MTVPALPNLDRSTLRERALVALRAAITTGRYRPGDHLGEVEIASSMSVSRGTVREALRHLQQEGLVVAGARGMLRVRVLSPQEVRELFQVREALEGLAVAQVIASPDRAAAVAALRDALRRLDQAFEVTGDLEGQVEADLAFHLLLCELSGNSMLVTTWRHLEGPTRIVVMSAAGEKRKLTMSAAHHAPIVDAIERGDADAALAILHEHMSSAMANLQAPAGGGTD
ncbi:GntR family transcriptional regulator [Streptomyces purpurogeneiscleroticus]|uniref:GntR family transcriptional regulator n=1 Tax=Streptomyces purpurogeneiscleroticus TaxID=68259 RepID=UPI001CBC6AD4|nr:GntR family transcriptional regulator [Streptomyces purpurogeneiscleroticus]